MQTIEGEVSFSNKQLKRIHINSILPLQNFHLGILTYKDYFGSVLNLKHYKHSNRMSLS